MHVYVNARERECVCECTYMHVCVGRAFSADLLLSRMWDRHLSLCWNAHIFHVHHGNVANRQRYQEGLMSDKERLAYEAKRANAITTRNRMNRWKVCSRHGAKWIPCACESKCWCV
jgi:hypothetical protein